MTPIRDILAALPHRYPFLMVDRVLETDGDKRIVAIKNVSANEPCFQGHFPGLPIFPGVLIVEAMAQAGALLAHASGAFDPARQVLYFAGMDGVRFRRPVTPGDQLRLEIETVRRRGAVWKMKGRALVDGALCAEAEILATVAERDPA